MQLHERNASGILLQLLNDTNLIFNLFAATAKDNNEVINVYSSNEEYEQEGEQKF